MAVYYHACSEGQGIKKAVYIAIGINIDGRKDVLEMWGCENYSFSAVSGTTNTPSGRW